MRMHHISFASSLNLCLVSKPSRGWMSAAFICPCWFTWWSDNTPAFLLTERKPQLPQLTIKRTTLTPIILILRTSPAVPPKLLVTQFLRDSLARIWRVFCGFWWTRRGALNLLPMLMFGTDRPSVHSFDESGDQKAGTICSSRKGFTKAGTKGEMELLFGVFGKTVCGVMKPFCSRVNASGLF